MLPGAAMAQAPVKALWDTRPDTWVAIDALKRRVPSQGEAYAGGKIPSPRPKRYVGMFYFLWLGEHGRQGPFDITKILQRDPNAMQ
ncbi:MAG: hypothetical protein JWN98_524, partial [Abditibacteriota bacterium]|nr:hypothetical protein [Abditibacteriota bacterium]